VASCSNAHRGSIDDLRAKGEARCHGPLRAGAEPPMSFRCRELRMSKVVKAPHGTPEKKPLAPSVKSRKNPGPPAMAACNSRPALPSGAVAIARRDHRLLGIRRATQP
jgi:hypothetical protein